MKSTREPTRGRSKAKEGISAGPRGKGSITRSTRRYVELHDPSRRGGLIDNRARAIARLNRTLRHPDELGGVFLPPGYRPQFDLMLLGEMPSLNEPQGIDVKQANFNLNVTSRDKFLQDMMVKYGAAGSYVTDIVKRRDKPRQPTKREILTWLPFLLKEITFIRPKGLVVLGKRTYEETFLPYVAPHIPAHIHFDYVFHYSSQVPRGKFEKRFALVITKLLRAVAGPRV